MGRVVRRLTCPGSWAKGNLSAVILSARGGAMKKQVEPKKVHPVRSSRSSFWTTLVLTVIAVGLLSLIIYPFAAALFVAAVLAGALHPVYEKVAARLRGKRQVAAGL